MTHATQPDFDGLPRRTREALTAIAKANLIETLETQRTGEDFFEIAVWTARQLVTEAYLLGLEHGQRSGATE